MMTVEVKINGRTIRTITVVNTEIRQLAHPANLVYNYVLDGEHPRHADVGAVAHCPEDGALVLARKVLEALT